MCYPSSTSTSACYTRRSILNADMNAKWFTRRPRHSYGTWLMIR
jgi:hypothetical protein